MIVRVVLKTPWVQILATGAFLMVLAGLLLVRVWIPPTFEGIDPERVIANRYKKVPKSSIIAAEEVTHQHNLD